MKTNKLETDPRSLNRGRTSRPKTKPAEGAAGKGAGFGIGDKLKKAAMYGAGTAMSMAGTGVGSSIFSRGDVS